MVSVPYRTVVFVKSYVKMASDGYRAFSADDAPLMLAYFENFVE